MSDTWVNHDDLKRRIRKLKKIEIKIRFGDRWMTGCALSPGSRRSGDRRHQLDSTSIHANAHLVWDDFFDLRELNDVPLSKSAGKYTLRRLAAMSKDEYKDVVGEFFWNVYYRFYRENGIMNHHAYDPDILSQLGLPFDADSQTIKKRFRDLAKRYHPDAGGEAAQFIEFMEQFKKLDGR